MTTPSKTHLKTSADIIAILDESGSMKYMGPEPLQALNLFIKEQQKTDSNSLFSLYTFNHLVKNQIDNTPLGSVQEVCDYVPEGITALYDCIHIAIDSKKETKNVVLVIITDGEDTCSSHSVEEIKKEIKTQEDTQNWQVIYLGANQDSFAVGGSMNMKPGKISSYNQQKKGDLLELVRACSQPISAYRVSSQSQDIPMEINLSPNPSSSTLPINSPKFNTPILKRH